MMDRNYPSSSFADGLAPAAQTAASWAFDRGSANIKPSPGYGPTHIDAELLPRHSYSSTHQIPTYTTSNIPVVTGTLEAGSGTPETSIMSFLSAMESRGLQTGPVSTSLLPPFRPPSWPAGTNSSTTELYLTGALASSSTYPSPAALSSYQHTGGYSSRTYSTNPSLALQDPAFSTSTNSPFSHHDTLLSVRPSQSVLPTALAFNHLTTTSLSSALPVQSSTYRSAQESAPHLLQPQYSLLPSTIANHHYGSTVFSGSVERALQRECSVIKHHQRPSSSHTASEQLSNSEHSLQGYFGSNSEADMSYQQDPSRLTPASYSSSTGTDSTLGVNTSPRRETDCVSQAYSSTSLPEGKDCSSKLASHPAEDEKSHSQNLTAESPKHYSSPGQTHNSVIANQQEDQLSGLMATSLSQTYITNHAQSQTSSISDKFSSLYKPLPSLSSQSDNMPSVSQTLVYTSTPLRRQQQEPQYEAQVQNMCRGNVSEGYPTVHTQTAPDVSFKSHSQGVVSLSQAQSYHTRHQGNSAYSQDCIRGLATSNSTVGDADLIQAAVGVTAHGSLSHDQTPSHKYVLYVPSYSSNVQTLDNNIRSAEQDLKQTYDKHKLEELRLQDLEGLQQGAIEISGVDNIMSSHNHVVIPKTEDHAKNRSVIRSNSRDDQLLGPSQTTHEKQERISPLKQPHIHPSAPDHPEAANTKTLNSTVVSSHVTQHIVQHETSEPIQQTQQNHSESQTPTTHNQFITIPSTQVLFEPNQMVLLQQPPVQQSPNSAKVLSLQSIQPTQGIGPVHIQYLQMDRDLLGTGVAQTQSRHDAVVSEQNLECAASSKHHYSQSVNQQPNDAKSHFALNTICFQDSMLLGDDRSILSNVDDILAATVAACGVAPQDFVKAQSTTEEEMAVMRNPVDSNGHFQAVDIRHISPSFSSAQQPIITNSLSHTVALTPNGPQMASGCQAQTVHHGNRTELDTNEDGQKSEGDYHLTGHVYNPPGSQNRVKGNAKCIKTEYDPLKGLGGEDFPKQIARSKSVNRPPGPEDDGGLARSAKRGGPAKRQNSRGSDASDVEGCPQQERIIRKIREVEEKQPEVKTGFIGSFLDFIKSGPKQQYSQNPTRSTNRPRKPSNSSKLCSVPTLPTLPLKNPNPPGPLMALPSLATSSHHRRLDEELRKNLETLPSFSSDEEENTGKNQALRNSICSVLSSLDEPTDRKIKTDNHILETVVKPESKVPLVSHITAETRMPQKPTLCQTSGPVQTGLVLAAKEEYKETPPDQLAAQLATVAIEGLTDEELSDSGGEGMYRERDEFVVRNEDIENLKVTMTKGYEPPAIWKVQKALLQKFVPELRDGKRVFSATNSYLGYFGDAKTMYHRVYVKFLDTVNKREYVRVCSRKPRCKPINSLSSAQVKTLLGLTATPPSATQSQKPRPKPVKPRAEPPPKKRRKWKEALSPTASCSSAEECGEDGELNPTLPSASRFLNTRTMKEVFRSFVELLVTISLDDDAMAALEKANDEVLLPNMKRVEEIITDNRKRLLQKLHIGTVLKSALDSFPEISVITERIKDGEIPAFKIRLSGKAYNKKTMKPFKMLNKVPQEYSVDQQKSQWFSLYHSLQHYKYHTYLICKDEISCLRVQMGDLGKGETVQKCLQNAVWVEGLFVRFGELINQVQQVCR